MKEEILKSNLYEKASLFPDASGVYIFKDAQGKIIYVGKSKSLRKRILSYFKESSPKSLLLLKKAQDLDYIITDSETEAFILEAILIKKYRPIYNVQLRDDKQYPILKLTLNEPFPRLIMVRRIENDSAKYFGPFPQSGTVRETISLVKKIFNLRSCSWDLPKKAPKRPCIYYDLKRCYAPCQGYISQEEYKKIVDEVILFLEGKYQRLIDNLTEKMNSAVSNLEFEKAIKYRDQIKYLQNLWEKQKIVTFNKEDKDLIQIYIEEESAKVLVYLIREGKLIEKRINTLKIPLEYEKKEIILSFLTQYYSQREVPDVVIVPLDLGEDKEEIEKFLSKKRKNKVSIREPIGEEIELLEMALKDLSILGIKRDKIWNELFELQKLFNLESIPLWIEGYDISNIQGKEAVGSRVVFYKGLPYKEKYRRYKIKITNEEPNDFLMLQEVIERRLKDTKDEISDIILIDGGRGQLNAVLEVFERLNIKPKFLIALAKREEEIYIPNRKESIKLNKDSPALHILQRVRDEAHRFALNYHRTLRTKKLLESKSLEIKGLGEKRWRILMEKFQSLDKMKKAPKEEFLNINGIPKSLGERIYQYLHDQH
ncbi:MAG: excinuclease ABC subunit UvrC [Dictyoglomus sp.]|nr:excinuclease ABC subunit UvrC [Dictyoglomus sp.]MCX7941992.1 excinuclease ABC subunit UvrC [Dictyoglomaceae bacterium]MDW8188746.1 excinuclease ABC subunit UvrC [Dictyoglomus sp.]